LRVTIAGVTATSTDFAYEASQFSEIYSVHPNYAHTFVPTEITITGNKFGAAGTNTVTVGSYPCFILEDSDTVIKCRLDGGAAGVYKIFVQISVDN
jgi:hypothetical protein